MIVRAEALQDPEIAGPGEGGRIGRLLCELHTFRPGRMHRPSRSTAPMSLIPLSSSRCTSRLFSLALLASSAGEAIELCSTLSRSTPSFGLELRARVSVEPGSRHNSKEKH